MCNIYCIHSPAVSINTHHPPSTYQIELLRRDFEHLCGNSEVCEHQDLDPSEALLRFLCSQIRDVVRSADAAATSMGNPKPGMRKDDMWENIHPGPVIHNPLKKVLCLHCTTQNDEDFSFCKCCGRKSFREARKHADWHMDRFLGTEGLIHIDEKALQRRKQYIKKKMLNKQSEKEKSSVMKKFELFIYSRWNFF